MLFFVFNGLGMLIALACLAVSHYVLGFHSALADNISANVIGLGLAMVFRFWSVPHLRVHQGAARTAGPQPGERRQPR